MIVEEKKTEICSECQNTYIRLNLKTLNKKLFCDNCYRWKTANKHDFKALADFYNNHVDRSKIYDEKWFEFKATFKRKFILKAIKIFEDETDPVFICGLCKQDIGLYWYEEIGVLQHLQIKHQDYIDEFKEEEN